MRAYTFIGGKLLPYIALNHLDPPMIQLGKMVVCDDHIAGDFDIIAIDEEHPPEYMDKHGRIFSQASYLREPSAERQIRWQLVRQRNIPEKKVLIRIHTGGMVMSMIGRWEVLGGDPLCLGKGFAKTGKPVSMLTLGKYPPVAVYEGMWSEGLFVFSPGDSLRVTFQRDTDAAYVVEYTEEQELRHYPWGKYSDTAK